MPRPVPAGIDPFDQPEAQRRFRIMREWEDLEQALDYPKERWAVFLRPAQRAIVERDFSGPARVSGLAGTGKIKVALYRAVHLALANPKAGVPLTTLSEALANALRDRLRVLVSSELRLAEWVEVYAIDAQGERLFRPKIGDPAFASDAPIRTLIEDAVVKVEDSTFSTIFMLTEREQVIGAWQLDTWEAYRDVPRLGCRRRLTEGPRRVIWVCIHAGALGPQRPEPDHPLGDVRPACNNL